MPAGNVRAPRERNRLVDVLPKWYTRERGEEGIYAEPPLDLTVLEGAAAPMKLVGGRIAQAAIKLRTGKMFTGRTHEEAFRKFGGRWDEVVHDDGFVTDAGEYLTREQAVKLLPKGSTGARTEDAVDIVGQALTPPKGSVAHYQKMLPEGVKVDALGEELTTVPPGYLQVTDHNPKSPTFKATWVIKAGGKREMAKAIKSKQQEFLKARAPKRYAEAKDVVSGLKVREEIPNTSSISATFYNPKQLSKLREVPMSEFPAPPDVNEYTMRLAQEIKKNKEINPLIVGIDEEGPYILEGAHRYDALKILKVKSFPAIVVGEADDIARFFKE